MSAAIYCSRANLKTLVFAGDFDEKGGLLSKTTYVENYPGYLEVQGFDLVSNMEQQAKKYGTSVIDRKVSKVEKSETGFICMDSKEQKYVTKTIIIATGAKPNRLYLPNEDKYWGQGIGGISSCVVCDGALFKLRKGDTKDKSVIVVGGGDSACEGALFLTKFTSKVTMLVRGSSMRASAIMQKRVIENSKIMILYNTEIIALCGEKKLEQVTIKILEGIGQLDVDGLFYCLGQKPNSELFKNLVNVDDEGYVLQNKNMSTSIPSMFSCGDVSDRKYRQAVVAAGEGVKAALEVQAYLTI